MACLTHDTHMGLSTEVEARGSQSPDLSLVVSWHSASWLWLRNESVASSMVQIDDSINKYEAKSLKETTLPWHRVGSFRYWYCEVCLEQVGSNRNQPF